jgi:uncharacterized glyoxalase superfamily protein PhnB
MKLHPHLALSFNGQCEAAFKLYEQCFNGTIVFMLTWGNSPMAAEAPSGWESKIYHATLKIGDAVIAGGDVAPERYATPKGFSVIVDMDDPDPCRARVPRPRRTWDGRHAPAGNVLGRPLRRRHRSLWRSVVYQL